jgi:hypothetical protein
MSTQAAMAKERVKTILITVDALGNPRVPREQEVVTINQEKGEEVRWEAEPGVAFRVDFKQDASPFYEDQFNEKFPHSGLARRGVLPSEERAYKYAIEIDGKTLDPTIKVYP